VRTPVLEIDLAVIAEHLTRMRRAFPDTRVHYAVKANPHPEVLATISAGGGCFDTATPAEISAALATGVHPNRLVFSNPVKRRADIADAHASGVDLFVVDSAAEVLKVAETAPGAAVLARLATSGVGSDWPLSRKFGCLPHECVDLLTAAARAGLRAAGIAFHVGSQQHDPFAWRRPIEQSASIFTTLARRGLTPWLLDLGGGFPARLTVDCPPIETYAQHIWQALHAAFAARPPQIALEPGRGIVADAGVLTSMVLGVAWRGGQRWVYLDAGVFTGLVETLDEAIRYRLSTSRDQAGGRRGPAVLAGPTCDSADVMYERAPVDLPLDLAEGDLVRFHSAGAYTSCYTTTFNGFDPLPTLIRTSVSMS
jgi:ornithine decarboxylase